MSRGHEVIAAAPEDHGVHEVSETLASWGVRFVSIPLARGGLNPLHDMAAIRSLKLLLQEISPDVLIAYTLKPIIYGGLVVRVVGGVEYFPMITGLGYSFTEGYGLKRIVLRKVVTSLYREGLKNASAVIFQNPDDQSLFSDLSLVPDSARSIRVFGSGVDLSEYPPQPLPNSPVFLMLARLVADKGVREYVEAARLVKHAFPHARFLLAGGLDSNPAAISQSELDVWLKEGVVDYLGPVYPVQPLLSKCRYYVLPSYREGTPRSVLEAMSTGRPVLTTDAPGCRETVEHGRNGLLVPPRDSEALAEAMTDLLTRSEEEVVAMAAASREIVRQRFDVRIVNKSIVEVTGL